MPFQMNEEDVPLNSTMSFDDDTGVPIPLDKFKVTCTYLMVVLIVIGCFGLASNSFAMAVVVKGYKRRNQGKLCQVSILIQSQTCVDLVTSLVLVLTYSSKVTGLKVEGTLGKMYCRLLHSECLLWTCLVASTFNLVCLSFERYLKIVFPIVHRQHFNKCKTMTLITISWISSFIINSFQLFLSGNEEGRCTHKKDIFLERHIQQAYGYIHLLLTYSMPLFSLIYFYGHIFKVIKKKVKHRGYHRTSSRSKGKHNLLTHAQINVAKTFFLVAVMFIFCWTPSRIYCFLYGIRKVINITFKSPFEDPLYKVCLSLTICNTCVNPFLYACKYEAFRKDAKDLLVRCGQPVDRPRRDRSREIALEL